MSRSKKRPGKKQRKARRECSRWLELPNLFRECGENIMTSKNLRKGRRKEKRRERRGREKAKEKKERRKPEQTINFNKCIMWCDNRVININMEQNHK